LSASLLSKIVRAGIEMGIPRPDIINHLGFNEARLRNPLNRISGVVALRLIALLERQLDNPAAVLNLGSLITPRNFSDLRYAILTAENLYEALHMMAEIESGRQNLVTTRLVFNANIPTIEWHISGAEQESLAPFVEFIAATYARFARLILRDVPIFASLSFVHAPRFDAAIYEAFFGCTVHFSAPENIAILSTDYLSSPSPLANAELLGAYSDWLRKPADWGVTGDKYSANSYFYLMTEIDKSPPTLRQLAAAFGTTERTLRRQLVDEGRPYRALLDEARRDLCLLYLIERKRNFSEIALLLGYSQLSAFTRAYRRWFGRPPSQNDVYLRTTSPPIMHRNGGNGGRSME
jgi:AraC-like DNA-binding protein